MDIEDHKFLEKIRQIAYANPEMAFNIFSACQSGILKREEETRKLAIEWETIAMLAVQRRSPISSDMVIAERISLSKDKAAFNWDHSISALKGAK